ncbi:MAG TPA: DUF4145 domain-containing protein [Gemmatimonadaceae bacterium]|jgi:hypothetical protein|nr:DUF4145 domain-containing protein [Gemmatimonadaceae bacterium]
MPVESLQRETTDGEVTVWTDFQIIQCQGCEWISFREVTRNTEDWDHDPETGMQVLEERVETHFTVPDRAPMDGVDLLPKGVRQVYDETLRAFDKQMPVLTAIGIRALVEAVCMQRKATGRALESQIDALVTQGVLTKASASVLHRIRLMGNAAAHEIKPPQHRALGVALDVVEHTLNGVYVLQRRARQALPRRPRKK